MIKIDLLKYSKDIKSEADNLLMNTGLLAFLNNFGNVILTGSYSLDLMMKKDLDISLVNNSLTLENFFEIGKFLSIKFNPHSMYFRNTIEKEILNRPPNSFYWGVQTADWKIDLWKVPDFYAQESVQYIEKIKSKLDFEKRKTILSIKYLLQNDPDYGRKFSSKELYKAVIDHNISTLDDFISFVNRPVKS